MNNAALKENVRSLADLLGMAEDEASQLLEASVEITVDVADARAHAVGAHIEKILSRTLSKVSLGGDAEHEPTVEIVVGAAKPRRCCGSVFVFFHEGRVVACKVPAQSDTSRVEPIALLLAACYACAAAMRQVLGDRLSQPEPETYVVDLRQMLGDDAGRLGEEVDFNEAFLAGAGAIGNGFVFAASLLPLRGKLHIADDDKASGGNLQRCVLFDEHSVGQPKAEVLAAKGDILSGGRLRCEPHNVVLQRVPQRKEGAWLRRLIVAVDSPRARRQLQSEMPCEVFDASTTGAEEVVLHFNEQPTEHACMACVYHHSPQEGARELHIAESLGVTLAEVRELRVSQHSADVICAKYNHLSRESVVGLAYDTLFKALCSSSKLMTPEGRQVLTPFAFVSVLAGAMLALEFFRRVQRGGHGALYNGWRLSPWTNPVGRAQRRLERRPDCQFCGEPILRNLAAETWATGVSRAA